MVRRLICLSGLSLLVCHSALALDATLDVSQYAHQSWKIRDGFPNAIVNSITQTSDGYLWLGTTSGLVRFDGVSHLLWGPQNREIFSVLAARDGSLWIGMRDGLARWINDKFTEYDQLAGFVVPHLLEDHEGTIWASPIQPAESKVCSIHGAAFQCSPINAPATAFYEDSRQNLWVGVRTGLWQWSAKPSRFYPMSASSPEPFVLGMTETKPGEIVLGTPHGARQFSNGILDSKPIGGTDLYGAIVGLLRDRDGGIWIGTRHGLLHVHKGRTDAYTQSDGLTGDIVTGLLEDREGNVWVATTDGLDKFRGFAIPTVSSKQGLHRPQTVLAAPDGSIWMGAGTNGLYRWKDGEVKNYRAKPVPREALHDVNPAEHRVRRIIDPGLGEDRTHSIQRDAHGRIWAAGFHTLSMFVGGKFTRQLDFEGDGDIRTMASDQSDGLWISHTSQGVIHLVGQQITERIDWSKFGSSGAAGSILSDPKRGGIWLGFLSGGIAYFDRSGPRGFYDRRVGLGEGEVMSLYLDERGTLWAGTKGGLSRLNNGRFQTLTTTNGLPCSSIHWVIQDAERTFWLGTACGVLSIDEQDLNSWASEASHDVHPKVFDTIDGVRSEGVPFDSRPIITKDRDGKLWLSAYDGVSIIDPRHLLANPVPPPVHVERVIADRKTYNMAASLALPPLVRDLEIDFTALSLVAPERVLFRYKLEGHDRDWQNSGNRRQAFYTDLSPGHYRFRVIASNNSGVWNEQGDVLDFSIAPAYWQTNWFRALCSAAFLLLLWAIYWLRLRRVTRTFNMTLEARVSERTRVARELHDTLLQSFQGVLLRFGTVQTLLPTRLGEAQQMLESAIEQARAAIREGRDAVQGLRSSPAEAEDFVEALRALGEELASDPAHARSTALTLNIEGTPRALQLFACNEIYRIASEALRNAYRHAEAGRIEVQLDYGMGRFELRVRDDGKGVDPEFLEDDELPGHFGLSGMRERAEEIGGKLSIWSAPGSGTELQLSLPGTIAYGTDESRHHSWLSKRFSARRAQQRS